MCCIIILIIGYIFSIVSSRVTNISLSNTVINFSTLNNYILPSNIPAMKQTLSNNSNTFVKNNLLAAVFNLQLPIINSLSYIAETDENDLDLITSENSNTTVEHADTGISTQIVDSNVPNTYTDSNNRHFYKKWYKL